MWCAYWAFSCGKEIAFLWIWCAIPTEINRKPTNTETEVLKPYGPDWSDVRVFRSSYWLELTGINKWDLSVYWVNALKCEHIYFVLILKYSCMYTFLILTSILIFCNDIYDWIPKIYKYEYKLIVRFSILW